MIESFLYYSQQNYIINDDENVATNRIESVEWI